MLQFLWRHASLPEFTCRFSWAPDSLVLWDNRSTQHKPVNDFFLQHADCTVSSARAISPTDARTGVGDVLTDVTPDHRRKQIQHQNIG